MKRLTLVTLALTLGGCGDPTIGVGDWQPGAVADDKQLQELSAYQAAKVTPDASIRRVEIERTTFGQGVTVIHDDKRSVTCWVYRTETGGYDITGGGISCTPDWMLAPQTVKP